MSRTPLNGPARVTVILLCLAWTVDYFDRFLVNLTLPHIGAEFGLDNTGQGMVLSVFFLAYAVCQIPGGLFADRFGAARVMVVGSFVALLTVRFLFGVAEGVFPGGSMKALSERTDTAQRMTANGWMQSSSAFAVLLIPLFAAPVVAGFGWRAAFLTAAGLGALVLLALWRWLPPATQPPTGVEPTTPGSGARTVLRSPVMWRFSAMFFGFDVIVLGLNSWVPKYLQSERGLSVTDAGAVALVPVLIGGVAVVIGGRWADRLEGRHRLIVVPAMAAAAPCLVAMATADTTTLFVAMLAAASLFAGLCYMPIFSVPMRSLPAELAGTGAAMIVFGGQAAGIVTPVVMGWLTDRYSYSVAFVFLVTGAVLTIVLALATPQTSTAFGRAVGVTTGREVST